jgi:hypothetical protein
LDSRLKQLVAREFGQFWRGVTGSQPTLQPFSRLCSRITTQPFWVRDVAAERIELALERGAPDTQPPRDLGHAAAIMRDGESDGLGFDLLERSPSQQAARVRRRNRGRK